MKLVFSTRTPEYRINFPNGDTHKGDIWEFCKLVELIKKREIDLAEHLQNKC